MRRAAERVAQSVGCPTRGCRTGTARPPPAFQTRVRYASHRRNPPIAESPVLIPLRRDDPRLVVPLLTIAQAAVYLDVPASTLHTWARGYEWRRPSGGVATAAPLVFAHQADGRNPTLPFIGLAEAHVLTAFRKAGVRVQRIRPALATLTREMGLGYALASRRLYTDGCEVLYDYARHQGDEVVRSLTVVRSGQNVFPEVVDEYLQLVTWDAAGWPRALRLPAFKTADVVVDVGRAYGHPILVHGDARVEDVIGRFGAGETIDEIAADFEVPREEAEDVIRVAYTPRKAA